MSYIIALITTNTETSSIIAEDDVSEQLDEASAISAHDKMLDILEKQSWRDI
ncbi:hypothetical protein LCGC14_1424990 [marine sediment metagenome]|uniref:Uncharacterized protein n=1 Tax=marine sediment metagenome TaxID=412755 RepID=A0A0F9JQ57_9ZZZZ